MKIIKRWAQIAVRCVSILNKLVVVLTVLVIAGLSFSVSYEVIMRYFFDNPTDWVTQVSTYSLVYIFFLPLAYAEQLGEHIKVDVLTSRISSRNRIGLAIVTSALSLFVFIIFAWSSMLYAQDRFDWDTGPPLELPLFPFLVAIPVGLFLLSLQVFISLINNITAFYTKLQDKNYPG